MGKNKTNEQNVVQYNRVKVKFLPHKYTQVEVKIDAIKLLLQVQYK